MIKYVRFICIFCILPTLKLSAQYGTKAQFRNIDFVQNNSNVVITYDLINARSKELFDIKVDIISSSGNKIEAKSLEGQFTNVKKGKKKQITWHLSEDYMNFEDNIYIELTAFHKNHITIQRVSKFEALGKSTIWPGWGSAQTTLKKINYSKGIFAYGFLISSGVLYGASRDESWRAAHSIDPDRIQYYKKNASVYENLSYVSLTMAGLFWVWEYGSVLFKPNISKNIKLDIELGYTEQKTVPMLTLKTNF